MEVSCNLKIDLKNKSDAKKVLESIKVDDFDFVNSEIKNSTLEAEIKSESISSLLHTVDDYLSCVSVAVKVLDKDK
jgi:tRNA threonylcarbamoyladenosine modification (KEOPS) complex  Pcc1 subunit